MENITLNTNDVTNIVHYFHTHNTSITKNFVTTSPSLPYFLLSSGDPVHNYQQTQTSTQQIGRP
jgi:hypothetical protein